MLRPLFFGCWFVLVGLVVIRCENNFVDPVEKIHHASLADIERMVRQKEDRRAVFPYTLYENLLQELQLPAYRILGMNEFRQTVEPSKILVCLRHDIDAHPFKALELAQMEHQYGIVATYFVLHSAEYYGQFTAQGYIRYPAMNQVYQALYAMGHEIGIHNDLITLMIRFDIEPLTFIYEEIDFYQKLGIPIWGTSAHGSGIAQSLKLTNYCIFSDFDRQKTFFYQGRMFSYAEGAWPVDSRDPNKAPMDTTGVNTEQISSLKKYSLKEFGFEYEAYHIPYNRYLSDSGAKWNEGRDADPLEYIRQCQPGDRLVILSHPIWWGKK